MRFGAIIVAAVTGFGVPAMAHPHIFIDAGLEVIFDDQGRATALRISWIYDDLTSLGIVSDRGMDEDFDGVLTAEELTAIAGFDMKWDAGFAGDSYALLNTLPLTLTGPEDWTASYKDAKLTSTHLRKFAEPVQITDKPLVVQLYDPTYYVGYTVVAETTLTNGDTCTAQTITPNLDAADIIFQAALAQIPIGGNVESEYPAVGAAYADEVRISCAAPS